MEIFLQHFFAGLPCIISWNVRSHWWQLGSVIPKNSAAACVLTKSTSTIRSFSQLRKVPKRLITNTWHFLQSMFFCKTSYTVINLCSPPTSALNSVADNNLPSRMRYASFSWWWECIFPLMKFIWRTLCQLNKGDLAWECFVHVVHESHPGIFKEDDDILPFWSSWATSLYSTKIKFMNSQARHWGIQSLITSEQPAGGVWKFPRIYTTEIVSPEKGQFWVEHSCYYLPLPFYCPNSPFILFLFAVS